MKKRDRTTVTEYEMRFPSGGVVMIDAGTLLAAEPEALRTLQKRLKQAAFDRTANGRPFRAGIQSTPMGAVFIAPVRHRKAPHPVELVRQEDGAAVRLVADLAGNGPPDVPAELPPVSPDAPSHADGPTLEGPKRSDLVVPPPQPESPSEPGEGIGTLPSTGAGRPGRIMAALAAAVALAFVLTACGDESEPDATTPEPEATEIPTDLPPPTETSPPDPPTVVPDHWYKLAERAQDPSVRTEVRVDAIRQMSQAGPNAHLVLPALTELATSTEPAIRVAAEEALEAVERTLPDQS